MQKIKNFMPKGRPKNHISYTQVSDFMACRRFYKLKYFDGKRSLHTRALDFGSLQHAIAHQINAAIKKDKDNLSFEDVESLFKAEFARFPALQAEDYTRGLDNMKAYALQTTAEKAMILHSEYEINKTLEGGATIVARIDRIDIPEPRAIEIVEFKSSPLVPSAEEVERDPQLEIYAFLIAEEQPDAEKIFVSRQTFNSRADPETGAVRGGFKRKVQKDRAKLQGIGDFLNLQWEAIGKERAWEASPDITGVCQYCPEKCPAYEKMLHEKYGEIDISDILAVADRFVKLHDQKAAVEAEHKEYRALLEAYFETNLKKEIELPGKVIHLKYGHKGPTKPMAALDYTSIGIQKRLTMESAIAGIRQAAKAIKKTKKKGAR